MFSSVGDGAIDPHMNCTLLMELSDDHVCDAGRKYEMAFICGTKKKKKKKKDAVFGMHAE